MMSIPVDDHLRHPRNLAAWLHQNLDGLSLAPTRPDLLISASFWQTIVHFEAMTLFLMKNDPGSAFCLAKPLLAYYLRGIWLTAIAGPEQRKAIGAGHLCLTPEQMIGDLHRVRYFEATLRGDMSVAILSIRKMVGDEAERQLAPGTIDSIYPPALQNRLLQFAAWFACMAGFELARMARHGALAEHMLTAAQHIQAAPPAEDAMRPFPSQAHD